MLSDLASPNIQPSIDLTADDFADVIREAFHDCNDMDGPHWPTVARKVAEAAGIALLEGA